MTLIQRIYKPGRRGPGEALWLVWKKYVGHKDYYLARAIPEEPMGKPQELFKYGTLPTVNVTPSEMRWCKRVIKPRG